MSNDFPTTYWHVLKDGLLQCDLCPNACKLKEGQRGICFLHQRKNNQIVLTNYGAVSGLAVDPIEKKPLYHFMPDTRALSFGTIGCNLKCKFCQNWNISESTDDSLLSQTVTPEAMAQLAVQHQCQSIAFTYNEPIITLEYTVNTAKACHELGIKTVAVTNGYICHRPRKEFFEHIDATNVDLKSFNEDFYRKLTGSKLQPILDTLIYLKQKTNVWLEITTLIIPGFNDDEKEIDLMTRWIHENLGDDVPLHFSAFHPCHKMQNVIPTPIEPLMRAREIAFKNGLHYVYIGNILHPESNQTYCKNCGKIIIERQGFALTGTYIINGACA